MRTLRSTSAVFCFSGKNPPVSGGLLPVSWLWPRATLRSRLLLGTGVGAAGVLLVSGVLLYAFIQRALWNEFDESLATKARSLAAMMEQEDGTLELEFDEANLPEFRPSDHAEFYQVWINGTEVFSRSPSLEDRNLELLQGSADQPDYDSTVLPDGRTGRIVGMSFTPRLEDGDGRSDQTLTVTLAIGRETAGIDETLSHIRFAMVAIGLAAVLVSLGALAWFVRRGLKPVGRLASQIEGLGESELSSRIEPAGIPAELLPVVDRLNDLLSRLESAFRRERRFTADVAHELRTPLAGVRSTLEVALSKQREPGAYQDAMRGCLDINHQMHRMVENLLSLARADANQLDVAKESIDLGALVRECWAPLAGQADRRRLEVAWCLQEPCVLESDRGKLSLVLQNILGNAAAYADDGGRISIESVSTNGQTDLTVTNTGSTMSQEDVRRVFDRFWRGDSSRQCAGQHCGLGLSLCKTLVELLGGSISAEVGADGTFAIIVRLDDSSRARPDAPSGQHQP